MHYCLSQCLFHEIIIVQPKNCLNRRVFVKSMEKCIFKMLVFVDISDIQTFIFILLKGTVMQIKKALINDRLSGSKIS